MNSVYARMAIYILSPILTTAVALIPGWGVTYADGVLTVDLSTAAGAAVAAIGLSSAVFSKWGVK